MPRDKETPGPIQTVLRRAGPPKNVPPPPPAPPPPPPPKPVSKVELALKLCNQCWSPRVRDYGYAQLRGDLTKLGLTKSELLEVRDILPTHSTGTTGERVRAVDLLLSTMEM